MNFAHCNWHIDSRGCYVISAIFLSVIVRALLSLFSACALWHIERMKFWQGFRAAATGFIFAEDKELRTKSDFLAPFFLGLLELLTYPVLLATDAYVIGAWIGFKAVAQWSFWKEHRYTFNRFLLGNALVVLMSYWLSWAYVVSDSSCAH